MSQTILLPAAATSAHVSQNDSWRRRQASETANTSLRLLHHHRHVRIATVEGRNRNPQQMQQEQPVTLSSWRGNANKSGQYANAAFSAARSAP